MDGEHLLNADTVGNAADGEGLLDAAVLLSNDGTLENLDTLAVAFLNLQVDTDGVTDGNDRGLSLLVLLSKSLHQIHNNFLLLYRRSWRRIVHALPSAELPQRIARFQTSVLYHKPP